MNQHTEQKISRLAFISTCITFGTIAIVQNALPLLLGVIVVGLGLSAGEVGIAFTLEGFAMGFVAFTLAPFIGKLPQRQTIWGAMALLLVTHLAMAFVDNVAHVMILRALGGAFAGLALVGLNNIVATSSDPVRFYGGVNASGILLGILSFMILPTTIELWGIRGGFWPIAAVIILIVPIMARIPEPGATQEELPKHSTTTKTPLSIFYLVAIFLVQAGQVAYYAYIERRATDIGLDPQTIGNALTVGYSLSLGTMLLASWMGERFGRMIPLAIGLAGHMICIGIVLTTRDPSIMIPAMILQSPFYFFSIPCQLGIGAALDHSGRIANFAIGIFFIGNGFGPMIGGFLIETVGYSAISVLNLVVVLTGLLIYSQCNKSTTRQELQQAD